MTVSATEILENEEHNLLMRMRRDPMVLSGLFTEVTRVLYLDQENLYPGTKTWSPTDEKGHVFIAPSNVWFDDEVNRRPAIFIDVGDLAYSTDKVEGIFNGAGFDLREGTQSYNRVVKGSVIWAHIGRNRGQALQYGCVTLDLIDGFSGVITSDFCFEKFDVRGILRPKQRKDAPKEWQVLVQADFQFQESFSVKQESPKLKSISMTLAGRIGLMDTEY